MANSRVYVENLNWGLSRRDLVEAVSHHGGAYPVSTQVVRKGFEYGEASWPNRKCSAIFTFASQAEAEMVVYNLSMTDYANFLHILAPGSTSLRAKLAYLEGSRSLAHAKALVPGRLVPRPPAFPPPVPKFAGVVHCPPAPPPPAFPPPPPDIALEPPPGQEDLSSVATETGLDSVFLQFSVFKCCDCMFLLE